jgi:hypothetical protein
MASYEDSVFINCPFDSEYRPIFYALVFAVHDCGYFARCALEIDDSGLVRIQKIEQIIADCRFGIHDISRVEPAHGVNYRDSICHLSSAYSWEPSGTEIHAKKQSLVRSWTSTGTDFNNFAPTFQAKTSLRITGIRGKL